MRSLKRYDRGVWKTLAKDKTGVFGRPERKI